MNTTACPICDAPVMPATDAVVAELLRCPECSSELEIRSLAPLVLTQAPSEEEDWGE